jgi:hypothetical protein
VRRALVVLALGGAWLILLAGPAGAHPGIENPFVPAHVTTTVALGVPSEEASPMVEIDVTLPPDFTLQHVDTVPGWHSDSSPGRLRFFNGNVAQGGYALFTFSGVFAEKRVVEVPVVTRAADGTTVNWDQPRGAANPAAEAFPGYPSGSVPVAGVGGSAGSTGHGRGLLSVAGAFLALALGALGALAAARSLRRRMIPGAPR